MQPIKEYFIHPSRICLGLIKKCGFLFSDSTYLRLYYFFQLGKVLHLRNPKSFNEKLQWLKIHNRHPEMTIMVDKYAVKEYVAGIIGEDHIIPTIGVWEKPEEIDWDSLPQQFVLKTTHGGGSCGVVICRDKEKFDIGLAISKLSVSMQSDIYRELREWPYKDVPKRIIAERYISDGKGNENERLSSEQEELRDYKFFCFDGEVKMFKVDFDRFTNHRANYYTKDSVFIPCGEKDLPPDPQRTIALPKSIPQMIKYAECLSKGYPFMRVDFYNCNDAALFGEITFYPASGMGEFIPQEWDLEIGKWLSL